MDGILPDAVLIDTAFEGPYVRLAAGEEFVVLDTTRHEDRLTAIAFAAGWIDAKAITPFQAELMLWSAIKGVSWEKAREYVEAILEMLTDKENEHGPSS